MSEVCSTEHLHLAETFTYLDGLPTIPAASLLPSQRCQPLAVLDSNVILDLWYWHDKQAQSLRQAIECKRLSLASSVSCLKELAAVLSRTSFALNVQEQKKFISELLTRLILVEPTIVGRVRCKDPDDEKFLNLSFEIQADFLFTKDKKVLRAARKLRCYGTKTMRPADFDETQIFPILSE